MFRIEGPVQHYAWGSETVIPEFVGAAPDGSPQAELWLGANAVAPAVRTEDGASLEALIEAEPARMLGAYVEERFGELPFLFKLLAVSAPLSIQVHPSSRQAEAGYAREAGAGIPLDAAVRIYRDRRAKPEMLYSVSRFEMLCGFRDPAETARIYTELHIPALTPVSNTLHHGGAGALRTATEYFAGLETGARRELVAALQAACAGPDTMPEIAYLADLAHRYPGDVGVLVASLLDHVTLEAGSAVYLPARKLHSYLQGVALELMGNSDNVVRAGLTPKHVDVAELLRIVEFAPAGIPSLTPTHLASGHVAYPSPPPEFRFDLICVAGEGAVGVDQWGPDILLCTEGEVSAEGAEAAGETLRFTRGQAVFVPAATRGYRIAGEGRVARATVAPPA